MPAKRAIGKQDIKLTRGGYTNLLSKEAAKEAAQEHHNKQTKELAEAIRKRARKETGQWLHGVVEDLLTAPLGRLANRSIVVVPMSFVTARIVTVQSELPIVDVNLVAE